MKKSKNIIYISLTLIILGLLTTLFMNDSLASKVTTIITMITAVIGAGALFIQFKRDKDVNQAEFILNYGKYFYEVKGTEEIESKLEKYFITKDETIFDQNDRDGIIRCLVWCEGLSVLIQKKILDIDLVDNLYSYRFFLIVHNPYIQNLELIPYAEYYKGLYTLHKIWVDYKRKTNQPIQNEENSLEEVKNYIEMCKKGDIFDHIHY